MRGVSGGDALDRRDGGASIEVRVMYDVGTSAAARTYTAQTPTTIKDGLTLGRYEWRHYNDSVVIFRHELDMNSGDAALIKLLTFKMQQTEGALRNVFNAAVFANNGDGGPDINGLANTILATGTVGLLNQSTYSWWAADVNAASPTSFAGNGLQEMRTMWVDTTGLSDGSPPDLIVTTPAIHTFYEGVLQTQQRFPKANEKLLAADPAFHNLLFHATPVVFDKDCQTGVMYFLNSKFLKLAVLRDQLFKMSEFDKAISDGQDAQVALVNFTGNLITDNRRKLGKITGFIA